ACQLVAKHARRAARVQRRRGDSYDGRADRDRGGRRRVRRVRGVVLLLLDLIHRPALGPPRPGADRAGSAHQRGTMDPLVILILGPLAILLVFALALAWRHPRQGSEIIGRSVSE